MPAILSKPMSSETSQSSAAPAKSVAPIRFDHVDFHYSAKQALFDVNMDIAAKQVTAFIGPSGCGKSTVLRCLNRMNDMVLGARVSKGQVLIDGKDINDPIVDITDLR